MSKNQFKTTNEEYTFLKEILSDMPTGLSKEDGCTPQQRSYIYGLCKKHNLDPRNLPETISKKSEVRDLTLEEASNLISLLREE